MNRSDTLHPDVVTPDYTRPLVVTLGLEEVPAQEQGGFGIREATSTEEVLSSLEREEIRALVLGPRVKATVIREILARIATQPRSPLAIIVGFGGNPESLQEFVDNGRVFYISRGSVPLSQLSSLATAAINRYELSLAREHQSLTSSVGRIEGALEYCIRLLNQTDPACFSGLLVEAVRKLVGADRAHFLLYDSEKETLSSVDALTRQERIESAASGLAAFIARTGERLRLERVGADQRYDPEADNPEGAPDDRLIAAPVSGVRGLPIGVLIAIRSGNAPAFSSDDVAVFDVLLDYTSPPASTILLYKHLEGVLLKHTYATDVFRREALDHYAKTLDTEGDLLQTSPSWLKMTHWLTVALLLASLAFMTLARVKERAGGLAVIRAGRKIEVAAATGGLVRSVEASEGERVKRGDLLVRFQDLTGATTSERFREQLRAPDDGIVADLRVRAGQQLAPGDSVASIVDENAGYELIILLPGQYAPQVRPGMQGIFKVDGYPNSYEAITIDNVGSEIVGPREAARYAGSTDALTLAGPLVVVRSRLESRHFSAGGGSYAYRDGMTARAEVDLRSEPMIVSLLPGLKEFLKNLK